MKLTCETTALTDAVVQAAKVAPKGESIAAGVVIDVDGESDLPIAVMATDLQVSFRREVECNRDFLAPSGRIRLPAGLFAGVLSGFPQNGTVALTEQDDGRIRVAHGRNRATLHQIVGTYPTVPWFSLGERQSLVELPDFASKVAQVAWACHKDVEPQTGVHIDGECLVGAAFSSGKAARVDCVVPIETPITVPLSTLAGLLRNTGTVRFGATGTRLLLMPDDHTQLTSTIYSESYPAYRNAFRTDFASEVKVDPKALSSAITHMLVLMKAETFPSMKLTFGDGVLGLEVVAPEVGAMEAEVDMDGGAVGSFEMNVTPRLLVAALDAAASDTVLIRYGPKALQSLAVVSGSYRSDLMPRKV